MPINNPAEIALPAGGSYAGDSSADKALPHSLGRIPIFFIAMLYGTPWYLFTQWSPGLNRIFCHDTVGASTGQFPVASMDASNIYVGNASSYALTANLTGKTYRWFAF